MRLTRIPVWALVLLGLQLPALGCAARGTDSPVVEVVGPTPAAPGRTSLRVATANLWGVSVLGFDWAEAIDERFAALAERLAVNEPDLDVVLIQEAWKTSARRALLRHPGVAARFPYRVDVVDRPGGAGLVVLSRLPIESARFHRFRAQGNCLKFWEGDCLAGKGILFVEARAGARSVWLGNSHLIACYGRQGNAPAACDEADPNGLHRWHQLAEVQQVISDLVGSDPILLGGDFNFTRSSRYHAFMQAPPHAWTEPGVDGADTDRLDFLWMRSGRTLRWHALEDLRPIFKQPVRLASGESVPLSDHPILAAEFCLVRIDDDADRCVTGEIAPLGER